MEPIQGYHLIKPDWLIVGAPEETEFLTGADTKGR